MVDANHVGSFQANQVQLAGPVPGGLYHRYVEFKPFIAGMFESNSIRGRILNRALHHQHTRIYNYDRQTVYGSFPEPCREMTLKFLELAHYDKGGRIFTYIITLDGKWRFTETGKEFGIDLLSKHTMHSDVNVYIAFSGEFFIRRHQQPQAKHENSHRSDAAKVDASPTHPPDEISGGPPKEDPPKDPAYYSLVIDNDSGTYRPNAKLLPELKAFLHKQLPGLHIMTLDCNGDKEKMEKLKGEQRDRKKKEGKRMVVRQQRSMSDLGSVSSSDEEDLEQQVRDYEGTGADATKEKGVKAKLAAKMHDTKEKATGHGYDEKAHADSVAPTTEQTVPSLNEKTTLPATRDPNSDMDTITPTTNGEVKSS